MGGERDRIEAQKERLGGARERTIERRLFRRDAIERRLFLRGGPDRDPHRLEAARGRDPEPQDFGSVDPHDLPAHAAIGSADQVLDQTRDRAGRNAEPGDLEVPRFPARGHARSLAAPEGRGARRGDGVQEPTGQDLAPQALLFEEPGHFDAFDDDRLAPRLGHDRPAHDDEDGDQSGADEEVAEPIEKRAERGRGARESGNEPARRRRLGAAGSGRLEAAGGFFEAVHEDPPRAPSAPDDLH